MSLPLALAFLLAATAPPERMLWSWYTTEITTPLPPGVGVAFVIASLHLKASDDVIPFPRRDRLIIPAGAYKMGVVRIEHQNAAFTAKQRVQTARMVAEAVEITGVPAIQIDFDAPKRAWPFYQALLKEVRRRLGPGVFLSMTALASWCEADSWLAGADADEFVPMLFRMGPAASSVPGRLGAGDNFPFAGCRKSAGVSIREPVRARARRIYIFPDYHHWTEQNVRQAVRSYLP